jgi:hypothetical protein
MQQTMNRESVITRNVTASVVATAAATAALLPLHMLHFYNHTPNHVVGLRRAVSAEKYKIRQVQAAAAAAAAEARIANSWYRRKQDQQHLLLVTPLHKSQSLHKTKGIEQWHAVFFAVASCLCTMQRNTPACDHDYAEGVAAVVTPTCILEEARLQLNLQDTNLPTWSCRGCCCSFVCVCVFHPPPPVSLTKSACSLRPSAPWKTNT